MDLVQSATSFGRACGSYRILTSLVGDANDTAGRTRASVASLERLLGVALAKVVGAGVNDHGAANDAVGADQLDQVVGNGALGVALSISVDVAEIANVADLIGGSTVVLAEGVEVRAGRGAAVGVVTKGVDVETTLRVGVVAGDVVGDGGRGTLRSLLEDDGAGDLGVSSKNADSFDHFGGCVYNCFDCCNGLLMTMMERWRGQSFEEERTSERAAFGSGVTKAARRSVWGLFRARGTSSSVLLSRPGVHVAFAGGVRGSPSLELVGSSTKNLHQAPSLPRCVTGVILTCSTNSSVTPEPAASKLMDG